MDFDVLIVGGGIAGASLAAFLPRDARVVILEREEHLGYHATGRSAAGYSEFLASPATLQLTLLSKDYLERPPAAYFEDPLLHCVPTLLVGALDEAFRLATIHAEAAERLPLDLLDQDEIARIVPFLRREFGATGIWDPSSSEVEVHSLQAGLLRQAAARNGTQVWKKVEFLSAVRDDEGWLVETSRGQVRAGVLVDAAGAWADDVAAKCGVAPIPVVPLRRTVIVAAVEPDLSGLPLVAALDESFYFKRDGGRLLMSPFDEIEDVPSDAQPEELDVAIAMDRLLTVTDLKIDRPAARWAGLRSFAPDREMVIGRDADEPRFVWLAGQGGTGIQTAVGAGRAAASLMFPEGCALPAEAAFNPSHFDPGRFRKPIPA